MTDFEIGYLAAFLDGEGCITCNFGPNDNVSICVRLNNTCVRPLKRAEELFGGEVKPKGNKKNRPMFAWSLYGSTAVPFLTTVLPYLLIKHEQAKLALTILSTFGKQGEKLSNQTKLYRHKLATIISQLNQGEYHDGNTSIGADQSSVN